MFKTANHRAGPFISAKRVLLQAKPGDLIELKRMYGVYKHWVVYIEDGDVIHFNKDDYLIKKVKLVDVCNEHGCRVNNMTLWASKKRLRPRKPEEIVSIAESYVGKHVDYKLLSKNCEHFATSCRYKRGFSSQSECGERNLMTIGIGTTAFLLIRYAWKKIQREGRRGHGVASHTYV